MGKELKNSGGNSLKGYVGGVLGKMASSMEHSIEVVKEADSLSKYLEEEKEKREKQHYLVEGAILTCTACTLDSVKPSEKEFTAPAGSNERQLKIVKERNYMNGVGQRFATIKDRIKWGNIEPFGNCKNPPNREKEIKDVQMAETSEELRKRGTCVYLMDLRDDWENLLGEEGYDSCPFCADMVEGITMEAILFCSHGGFIYPKSSGYVPTETIEDKILMPPNPQNPDEVMQYLWDYFLQQGFSEVAVAGILGNVSTESKFDPTIVSPSNAHGLFQWLGKREDGLKAYAKEIPGSEENWIDANLKLEDGVLQGTRATLNDTDSPSEAALIWGVCFEREYVVSEGYTWENGVATYNKLQAQQERQDEAERIYDLMNR